MNVYVSNLLCVHKYVLDTWCDASTSMIATQFFLCISPFHINLKGCLEFESEILQKTFVQHLSFRVNNFSFSLLTHRETHNSTWTVLKVECFPIHEKCSYAEAIAQKLKWGLEKCSPPSCWRSRLVTKTNITIWFVCFHNLNNLQTKRV